MLPVCDDETARPRSSYAKLTLFQRAQETSESFALLIIRIYENISSM